MSSELRENFEVLREELANLDRDAALAISGNGDAKIDIDLFRWRERKRNLQLEIPIVESRLIQSELPALKAQYFETKNRRNVLQRDLTSLAEAYQQKVAEAEEAFERHAEVQIQLYGLDQTILETVEQIAERKRRLKVLVAEVVGVESEEVRPDNRLILN